MIEKVRDGNQGYVIGSTQPQNSQMPNSGINNFFNPFSNGGA